jgi:DNA-binding transcriptional regulator YiaG
MEQHPIIAARQKRGLSQAGLAALLGVSQPTIHRWETVAPERLPKRTLLLLRALPEAEQAPAA